MLFREKKINPFSWEKNPFCIKGPKKISCFFNENFLLLTRLFNWNFIEMSVILKLGKKLGIQPEKDVVLLCFYQEKKL